MNLVLDFGNTRIKAGVFNGNELVAKLIFGSGEELLAKAGLLSGITHCFIASVTKAHEQVQALIGARVDTRLFTAGTPVPINNLYKSASTLGSDRLAAAVGAFSHFPNRNVLTIDAGTCIKYNFVNQQNEFLGGAISPGIAMRLKAMHEFTGRLPLAVADPGYEDLIGTDTNASLLSGAINGAGCEAVEMVARYQEIYPDLQVCVTGGDCAYLGKQLKNRFFTDQNLVLQGLNTILKFNIEKPQA